METETVTALVVIEQLTPMQLFTPGTLNPILERIKAEVRAIETDISTDAGRKAIGSLGYKIARTKTFIDDQRKSLVSDEKKRLAAIDAEGRRVWDELDALRDEVEKPLTEWKDAEKKRIAEHEAGISSIDHVSTLHIARSENVEPIALELDRMADRNFQEFTKRASAARERAALHLQEEKKRLLKSEAEAAEAERSRAEAEEKARVEREAKIAEDARLKAEAEAKRREEAQALAAKQREEEQARIAAEEKSRLEREKKASEERLQKSLDEAKAKAQRDKLAAEERDRKTEADKVAARERAEAERERAVLDERKRQEDIRAAEEAQRTAIAREKVRREADQAHRLQVKTDAYKALVDHIPGLSSADARTIVNAIVAGLIPGITINY